MSDRVHPTSPRRRSSRSSRGWPSAAVLLPALLLAGLVWQPAAFLPAPLAAGLAFTLLLLYPGYLLVGLLRGRWSCERSTPAEAFALSLGLWSGPAAVLQLLGGSLHTLLILCAGGTALLAAAAAVALHRRAADEDAPLHPRRRSAVRAWIVAGHVFFWGAVLVAVGVFVRYASIWRPSDRWTYQGVVRALLDSPSLHLPANMAGLYGTGRLEVSPWLALIAALQQLSAAPLADLYSFFLPAILLFLAVSAAFTLGRQVLNGRWGAGLAAALLVLYWLGDIALPSMAHFSWQERMLLRLDGGQSTLGQWALLGRIVEDKFVLIFVALPAAQAALLRTLYRGGRLSLLLWALMAVGTVLLHPLGIVFVGLSFAAVVPFLILRRRRRAPWARLGIAAAVLAALALVPLFQRQQLFGEDLSASAIVWSGQGLIDLLPQIGLWTSSTSDTVFALHPYLIGRRELLVLALILLPLLLLLRGLRRPGLQWISGLFALSALVTFNPLLAPYLARLITVAMLFRTYWLVVLPAMIVLALAVQTAAAWMRGRRSSPLDARARRGLAFAPLIPLLLLGAILWPKIDAGMDLLGRIQGAALSADERAVLHYLRMQGTPGSTVLAPEWLGNELPGEVGHSTPLSFRGSGVDAGAYFAVRDLYLSDDLRAARLLVLDRYAVDYVVAPLGSPIDLQVAELAPAAELVFAAGQQHVYRLTSGWQQAPLPAALLAAQAALDGGDLPRAAALSAEARRLAPQSLSAAQLAVTVAQQQGDDVGAVALAREALAAHPEAAPAHLLLADAYVRQGAVAAEGGRAAEAAAAYHQALAVQADHLEAARGLIALHAAGGVRLESAESDRLLALFAAAAYDDPERLSYERRQALWELADMNEQLRRPAAAEAALRDALALSRAGDSEAEAAAHLGRFYVRSGAPAQAQALYTWAIDRNGAGEAIYAAAADLAAALYGPDAAAVLYRAAAAANPLAAWPHVRLARLAWEGGTGVGAMQEALAELKQAQAKEPAAQEAWALAAEITAEITADTGGRRAERAVWEAAAAANPSAPWPLMGLAAAAREEGDAAAALGAWQRAAALSPDDAQLAAQVEETAAALDRQRRAEGAWQRIEDRPAAAVFVPLDLPAPAANGGGDSGANRAADPRAGWTLAGYGADPAALLSGDPTPLWLFWAAPDVSAAPAVPATLAAAGWRRIDATLWMQHVPAAINLVANGSFEGEAGASGFPQDYYAASPPADPAAGFSGRSVEAVVRGGRETQAAVLSSGPANPSTSFVSPPIAVTPGRLYLQAGALRGAGGRGYLGRNWLLAGGGVQEEYLFAGEENGAWQQGAVLAAAPPDAAAVQVLLLNRNATGRVCFDDILLLGLDLAAD